MRVYVASNFVNNNDVKKYMNELTETGHDIVYDWTCKNNNLIRETDGIDNIKNSQILIALIDHQQNKNNNITFTEIGCAIGQNKSVLLYNTQPQNTVYHHKIQVFNTLSELTTFLKDVSTIGIF